jgi:hypothetical protein
VELRVVYECGTKEKYPYCGGGEGVMTLVFRQEVVNPELTAIT